MIQYKNHKAAWTEQAWVKGAIAGTIATGPMTIFMLVTQRFLPKGQHYDLPPEILTKELTERAHIRHHMSKQQILGTTMFSHFSYGAAMGLLYGPLAKKIPLPAIVQGTLFGLLVWASSYLGLLPLLGMKAAGSNETGQRNLMMIAAHIVWGATLGTITDLRKKKNA